MTGHEDAIHPVRTAAIMQPYFLPYIGYFQLIAAADVFLLYGLVSHRKKSWITRNRISMEKNVSWVGPELSGQNNQSRICDVSVAPSQNWRSQLLRKMRHCYARAKHYREAIDFLSYLLMHQTSDLAGYNSWQIEQIARYLGIATHIETPSLHMRSIETELLSLDDPEQRRNLRVARLCGELGATTYLNPASGSDLYDANTLGNYGLALTYLQPDMTACQRVLNRVDVDLSIIHLLMHCGRDAVMRCLSKFTITTSDRKVHI
jgi:hypothetical protein